MKVKFELNKIFEHREEEARNRFLKSVAEKYGCSVWTKSLDHNGYGIFSFNYHNIIASRAAYQLFVGDVGNNLVLHKCDNPACVKPEHLFLGNQTDNMRDCSNKKRLRGTFKRKDSCKRGHKFELGSYYVHTSGRYERWICLKCAAIRAAEARKKDPTKQREASKRYYTKNRDKILFKLRKRNSEVVADADT